MSRDNLLLIAETLGMTAKAHRAVIVTAESCTGGLLASLITEVPGSSEWFDRGYVTYAVQSKIDLLDVPADLIERHGVVSCEVAEAMARGALGKTPAATIAMSVTGLAGPGGGEPGCPVGTVCLGWAERLIEGDIAAASRKVLISGERSFVREKACELLMRGAVASVGMQNPLHAVVDDDYR